MPTTCLSYHPGFTRVLALGVALLAPESGCNLDGLVGPIGDGGGRKVDAAPPKIRLLFPQSSRTKADLLFMIDNSNSMDAMQAELQNRFGQLLQPFSDLAASGTFADLNIGVVTSDFGAGATSAPGCTPSGPSGGGDQGRLQARGHRAASDCQAPIGTSFIHHVFSPDGRGRSNLPPGQTLLQTFTCMASVGSSGCGLEHQLESVYAALHGNIVDNQGNATDPGFVRDDALLVVVFLTNEDDASAPPDTDVFDKNKTAQYGYEDSYSRQTRFAVQCGTPPAFPPYGESHGPLASCIPAPNPGGAGPGKQFDVSRYVDFFTRPGNSGGVKADPNDVALVGIDGPEEPFEVLLSNPGTPGGLPYERCSQLNEMSNPPCVPVLQHSCVGANPAFFADPSVRLNYVIKSAGNHAITSICDNDFGPALVAASKLIVTNLGGGCVTAALPRGPGGQLVVDCDVVDETQLADGNILDQAVPACDGGHTTRPCWTLAAEEHCRALSPDGVGLTIDRGLDGSGKPVAAPPHTTAILSCS